MKETTQKRLKEIMKERNLKQIDILNMSKKYQDKYNIKMSKSHLSQYVNGKSSPDQHKLYLLAKTLNVSEAWLLGYEVPKEDLKINSSIETIYNQLNEQRQTKVYDFAKNQLEEQNKIVRIADYKDIELTSKVSAGRGIVDLEPEYKETIQYVGEVPRNYDMAFQVAGDSMQPIFQDGDIIFVECQPDAINGALMVVQVDDEAFVKKVYIDGHTLRLVSLNKEYNDIYIDNHENIKIIGKVVF